MSLHIVQLGPVPPPEGGVSRNIAAIRDRSFARGHRTSWISTTRSQSLDHDVPQTFFPRSPVDLIKTLRRLRPDVAHLHVGGEVSTRVLLLALAVAIFSRKSILTMHSGGYVEVARNAAKHASLAGYVFRRFSHIVAVNRDLGSVFHNFGVAADKLSVILPFAIEPPPNDVELRPDIKEFISSHSPVFVSIGGCEMDYEPLMQIKAIGEVRKTAPDAGLVIVGGGSLEGELRSTAPTVARDSILLTGAIDHPQVLRLIDQADAMLRITLFDGDAISVREALYLGTPVIATDNAMRPSGVELIPQHDREALVEAMQKFDGTRSKVRRRGLTPDYSNIDKIVDLYEMVALQ